MRYIGNKRNLIDDIESFVRENIPEKSLQGATFLDLFAGTNSVANHFKRYMPVITNDSMYFSYVLAKGSTTLNNPPDFSTLMQCIGNQDVLDYLNSIPEDMLNIGFISTNYTALHPERNYLSIDNGKRIDTVRNIIEDWFTDRLINETSYFYLLACLVRAVSRVSNTSGSYASFLKKLDDRAIMALKLVHPMLIDNHQVNQSFCMNAEDLASEVYAHICYIDPPYGKQQYTSNYHLLETICLNDTPVIKGKTGVRQYEDFSKSKFCSTVHAAQAMFDLIDACQSPHIIISYTSRGILSIQTIKQALAKHCDASSIVVHKFNYHTHKGGNTKKGKDQFEYLFYAHKPSAQIALDLQDKNNLSDEPLIGKKPSYDFHKSPETATRSPINYQDHQYDYIDQVLNLLPLNIKEFVDVFTGSMTVAINVNAERVYVNDIKSPIIEMLEYLANTNTDELIDSIESEILHYGLSRINLDGFLRLRDRYNTKPTPLDLYLLISHSYNNHFRYNSKHHYNAHFGRDRSSFTTRLKRDLIGYSQILAAKNILYSATDFRVFMSNTLVSNDAVYYCHPPSLLLLNEVQDLEGGFPLWSKASQSALYALLDDIDSSGVRFMLVDVLEYKGVTDDALAGWSQAYTVKVIDGDQKTKRIAICNY